MKMKNPEKKSASKLEGYLELSKSIVSKPVKHTDKVLGVSMALALFGALQTVEAQIVYSGVQNVACNLAANSNRCYANIDLAGGNDFEIHRNVALGNAFIDVDEVPGGGFDINGFNGNAAGSYAYPYALAANAPIGPAGPWGFGVGQANTLSELNNAYPGDKWTPLANGTTRFIGFRGVLAGQTKYGWIRLTKNGFGNFTIVDWAYNNSGARILAGQLTVTAANVSISGRVMNSQGRGVANVQMTLTDANGQSYLARTNSFGYFNFKEIESGQTIVINAVSKRYQFNSQSISVNEDLEGLIFNALP